MTAALAAVVPLLMRLPLRLLDRHLTPGPPRSSRAPRPAMWDVIPRHVEVAIVALRPLVRPGCLTRGVTSYALLRRAGLDVVLRFGVGQREGRDVGHCWLVRDGQPWQEKVDPRDHFVAVSSLPLDA
jgi:hypothetical protein